MATEEPPPVLTASQPLHPVAHWEQLTAAAEAGGDEADSVISSNPAESTASITSSILSYRTIHGRTFHSELGNAEYWASNDEQQNESMDIVDFADTFPSAKVVGTDISPIQPSWVPPNLEFYIDDCTQPWTFEPGSFDFIHMRYLYGSIKDWSALFRQAFRVCRPGGWVESHEASAMMESDDDTVTDSSAMHEWGRFFIEGGKKMERSFTIVEDNLQQRYMQEAGFVDIQIADRKIPIGGWAKDKKMREIGQYVLAALELDIEGYVLYMASQLLGWRLEEVKVYCAQLRRELRSGRNHPFFRYRVVWPKARGILMCEPANSYPLQNMAD
ncbi:hypothetical protein F66182_4944 [Fusarium sp. NRRL 66182]|nr:hypothetical protein F66182_4944 [Fusarium sp. NRRL 66182]